LRKGWPPVSEFQAKPFPKVSEGSRRETTEMARAFLLLTVLLTTAVVFAGSAGAAPKGDSSGVLGVLDPASAAVIGTDDDLFAITVTAGSGTNSGAMQFGPYPSVTTDSGTCGVDWAEDTVDRYFMIQQTGPITYRVVEKYKDGTFTVFPGTVPSPGACDNTDGTGPGVVDADVSGTFHGYDMIAITSATYTPETASCASPCASTNEFLVSVFGAGAATRDDYAFFFHYVSNDTLVYHEWKNASCNRSGNHGDIQSAPGVAAEVALCP
jgi:hypothetical protein